MGLSSSGLAGSDVSLLVSSHIFCLHPLPPPSERFPSQLVAASAPPLGHGMRGFHDTRKHTAPAAHAAHAAAPPILPLRRRADSSCRLPARLPTTHYPLLTLVTSRPSPLRRSLPPSHPQSFPAGYPIAHIPLHGRLSYLALLPLHLGRLVLSHATLFTGELTPSMETVVPHTKACRAPPRLTPSVALAGRHMPVPTARSGPVLAKWPNGVVPLILLPTLWWCFLPTVLLVFPAWRGGLQSGFSLCLTEVFLPREKRGVLLNEWSGQGSPLRIS